MGQTNLKQMVQSFQNLIFRTNRDSRNDKKKRGGGGGGKGSIYIHMTIKQLKLQRTLHIYIYIYNYTWTTNNIGKEFLYMYIWYKKRIFIDTTL